MTKTLAVALVLGIAGAGAAFAQTVTVAPPANPPGVVSTTTPDSKNAAAPVAGANSFTEAQARSRLEAHGYINVSALTKDDKSIWRGKASLGGTLVDVSLDYQGNIVANK
jgi:hypothetical protein